LDLGCSFLGCKGGVNDYPWLSYENVELFYTSQFNDDIFGQPANAVLRQAGAYNSGICRIFDPDMTGTCFIGIQTTQINRIATCLIPDEATAADDNGRTTIRSWDPNLSI